jgi:Tfp pilus assembly protein PilN
MIVEMSNALALLRWHGMREFRNASQNQIIFWVVAGMAVLALLVMVVQRRRRRWF